MRALTDLLVPDSTMATDLLHQRIRYDYDRPVADVRQRLVVVPRSVHGGQRRRSWFLQVEGATPSDTRVAVDRFGNHVLEVDVPEVAHHVVFVVDSAVDHVDDGSPHLERLSGVHRFPTRLTTPDPAIVELAGPPGRSSAAELCRRVHAALRYEWGITSVRTTAAEALAGGVGVCQDYAHVMIAACHLVGLPARYVSGHLRGEGGSHAWVEVLHPSADGATCLVEAWDPTHDRRAGQGYVTVAVGRDYDDVPPMSGSYAGDGIASALSVTKRVAREGGAAA